MKSLVILAALALAACGKSNTAEPGAGDKIDAGEVALWAVAPDGTHLWMIRGEGGRRVYFASTGSQTSHAEYCGKNCWREVDDAVPTATGGQ